MKLLGSPDSPSACNIPPASTFQVARSIVLYQQAILTEAFLLKKKTTGHKDWILISIQLKDMSSIVLLQGMLAHSCNPSIGEPMAGECSLRPVWCTQQEPKLKTEI